MSRNDSVSVLPIDNVTLDPANLRQHGERSKSSIEASLTRFGAGRSIVLDGKGVVRAGNGTLEAARKIGMTEVLVVKPGPGQIVAVQRDDWTASEGTAYAIADNRTTDLSEFDEDGLAETLRALQSEDFDLGAIGFTDDEVDEICDKLAGELAGEDGEAQEDDFETPDVDAIETRIQRGDLIELGRHRVLCGDSTNAKDVALLVNGDCIGMIITDPPYGVSYVGKTKDAMTLENDSLDEDLLAKLWKDTCGAWLAVTIEGGAFYAAVPPGPLHVVFLRILCDLGVYRQQLVWAKDSMVLGHSDYHYKHEPILYGWKPGKPHYFTPDRTKTSILEYARPKRSTEHPTMKPVELWAELISNSSKVNTKVGDPFLGSGTTLIASEQLGRTCFGMEIDPRYCQVIIDRYGAYCEAEGKPFDCMVNGIPSKRSWPV